MNSTIDNNKTVSGNGGAGLNAFYGGKGGQSGGGGIQDFHLRMANTTVTDNRGIAGNGRIGGNGLGGGILVRDSQWNIINSTVTGNSVTAGAGTEVNGVSQGAGVFVGSSSEQLRYFFNNIVAENSASSGPDVFGSLINPYNNLVGIGDGATGLTNGGGGNLVGTKDAPLNPTLAPLGKNGGLTQTRALLPGSPAVNAGSNSRAINTLTAQTLQFDQRGFQRIAPSSGIIDIGALNLAPQASPRPPVRICAIRATPD